MLKVFRNVVGLIFFVAGQFKLHDWMVGYNSSALSVQGVNVMPGVGAVELMVGFFLLSGIAPRVTHLTSIAILACFLSYSGVAWATGGSRCRCFGSVSTTPGHAVLLDIGLLALGLAALRRQPAGLPLRASHPLAGVLIATAILGAASPARLFAQPVATATPKTELHERFLREYPSSLQRLKAAVAHAEGEGRSLRTGDSFNRKQKSRDDMAWVDFRFVTRNDSLRLDRIVSSGSSDGLQRGGSSSLVLTPGFNFTVAEPNSASAKLGEVSKELTGKLLVSHSLYWRDFFPACFLFFEAQFDEWMKRPGFQIVEVKADATAPDLVRIVFRWDGAEWFRNPSDRPADCEVDGEWLLSPAEDWSIRRASYRNSYSYSTESKAERQWLRELGTMDVATQRIPNVGVVPRRVEIKLSRSPGEWSELVEVETKIFEFESVRPATSGDAAFTPESLGVRDPRGINWVFVILNAVIVLVLVGAWYFRRKRRET